MSVYKFNEDLIVHLSDYDLPKLSCLLRQIVLDYAGRYIEFGYTLEFEKGLPGIVRLLDYLDTCEINPTSKK